MGKTVSKCVVRPEGETASDVFPKQLASAIEKLKGTAWLDGAAALQHLLEGGATRVAVRSFCSTARSSLSALIRCCSTSAAAPGGRCRFARASSRAMSLAQRFLSVLSSMCVVVCGGGREGVECLLVVLRSRRCFRGVDFS